MRICERVIQAAAAIAVSVIALASPASAVQISNIEISGGFDDGHQLDLTPFTRVDVNTSKNLSFNGNIVPFTVTEVRTDRLGTDRYTDVVTISYGPLSGTPFLGNPAELTFSGYNADNRVMPIIDVIDYTKSFREASSLPERLRYIDFQTEGPGLANSAPDTGFFTLSFLHVVPVPAALPLLATGLAVLCLAGWRRHRGLAGAPSAH